MSALTFLMVVIFAGVSLAHPANNVTTRIINGNEVVISKYPYVAGIWLRQPNVNDEFICGGVIIRRKFLITTAQCVDGRQLNSVIIVANTNQVNGNEGSVHYISKYIVHPNYDRFKLTNNIAVVETASEMLKDADKRAKLANKSYQFNNGDRVDVVGFGAEYFNGQHSWILKAASAFIISPQTCQNYYINVVVNDQVVCFGDVNYNNRPGACDGDQGSPVVHNGSVLGLVSQIKGCGTVYPDIGVAISQYFDWVKKVAV